MRAHVLLVIILFCVSSPVIVFPGQNPDLNIFIAFEDGSNYVEPGLDTLLTAFICFENFGEDAGLIAVAFRLERTFGGSLLEKINLLGGVEVGDPELGGWAISGGGCVYPDTNGVVVAARMTYLYTGPPGTISLVSHYEYGRTASDCASGSDEWCVRLNPSGNGGVWTPPPPGDCVPVFRVWHVPSEAPTIQAGLDSAACGDTVEVACGTYFEYEVIMKNGVVLRSETGLPECVTVDATNPVKGGGFQFGSVDSTTIMQGFTLTGGSRTYNAGNTWISDASPRIQNCYYRGNSAGNWGGAIYCENSSFPLIEDCVFVENTSGTGDIPSWSGGGGLAVGLNSLATIRGCTFYANSSLTVPKGGGIACRENGAAVIENTIISFSNSGEAVYCEDTGTANLACCDVYGNAGGDWVGCIAGQDTMNGNLWADPLFYYPAGGDLRLRVGSPCIDAPGCGQIGALGQAEAPRIWHVPSEAPTIQAGLDSAAYSDTVEVACGTYYEYDVDLKSGVALISETGDPECVTIDAQELGCVLYGDRADSTTWIEGLTITGGSSGVSGSAGGLYGFNLDATIVNCHLLHNSEGGMRLIGGVPTIRGCTFTDNGLTQPDGAGISFDVTLATVERCVFTENHGTAIRFAPFANSTVTHCTLTGNDLGVEVDGPTIPVLENSIIAFSRSGPAVICGAGSGLFLECCDIYGNAGGDWVGCIAEQAGIRGNFSEDPLYCNPELGDFSIQGNSPCAPAQQPSCDLVGADSVGCVFIEVPEFEVQVPPSLLLGSAAPNPSNLSTTISYGIPPGLNPCAVSLEIYDPTGRRVCTLVDGLRSAGSHRVIWDGTDAAARTVASGIYFYRLTWNGQSETRRLVLVR